METSPLIESRNLEIKFGPFRVGNASSLNDPLLLSQVQDYKRLTSSRMIPLDESDIAAKVPSAEFLASRKIDGEFSVLAFRNGQALTVNPGGTVRVGLPLLDEVTSRLQAQGITSALIVGELHTPFSSDRRERIHDVIRKARGPESAADLQDLQFSVFDLLEVNGRSELGNYPQVWRTISDLFGSGRLVRPVPTVTVKNANDVQIAFREHVTEQGAEGLVLRSEIAGLFKIKPRYTLDAVVIGFTESTGDRTGMAHDLLLAVRRQDGTFHVLCRVGGGFSDDLRRTILSDLKDRIVASEYAEVNSDHVAYQMVEPRMVIEISCLDMISHSTRGAPINRMTLDWDREQKTYRIVRRLPLVSVISPQFVRFRDDKSISFQDLRIDQISAVVDVPLVSQDARQMALPKSEILRREVFTKSLKGEIMVRKFVMWKTNKETATQDHPAYVVHFTDYSPNRATPLSREVRVSNSRDQIERLFEQLQDENIKKGWSAVTATEGAPTVDGPSKTEMESGQPNDAQGTQKELSRKNASTKTVSRRDTKDEIAEAPNVLENHVTESSPETPVSEKKSPVKKPRAKKKSAPETID